MQKIVLEYPVTVEGKAYKDLTMRRAKVRDLKLTAKQAVSDEERETLLFSSLCEVPPSVIEELDMADYAQIQETYKGFLSRTKKSATPADS